MGKPQAVAPEADPTANWRQALAPVAGLKPSPTNPRTTFDPAELAELTENVRRYGVLQPLLVRPVPIPGHPAPRFDGPRWDGKLIGLELEVVAGERRRRAALAAGLAEVPVVVRLLTDEEVLAIQLTEIDQSVGIKVSERVRAYGRLAGTGKTAEEIAATVERPVKFVRGLLRMARLPAWALAAVDRGILPRGTAELVARVPGEEGRKRAAGCVLLGRTDPKDLDAEEWNDGDTWEAACEGIALGGPPAGVLSSRDAEALIRTHFTRELKTAPFSRKSLDLLPDAGSCDACPKRAGNDPEATAEGTRADTCLDPDCFRRKVEALGEQERAKFRRKFKLADGEDVNPDGAALAGERPARGWCDWNGTVGGSELTDDLPPQLHTRKVSDVVLECPVVHGCRPCLVLDDKHKPHVLVKTADARKTLVNAGVLKKPDARPAAKKPAAGKTVPAAGGSVMDRLVDEACGVAPAGGAGAGTTPAAPDEGDVAERAVTNAVRILGEFTEMNADDLKLIYGVTGEDFHCSNVFESLHLIARYLIRDHTQFGPERERFLKDALGCGATGSTAARVLAYEAVVGTLTPEKLLGFCVRAAAGPPMLNRDRTGPEGLAKVLLDHAELDWEQLLDQARRELAGGETADEKLDKAEASFAADEPPPAPTTTPLSRIDGIPDAVLDLLMGPDATGKLTLERVLADCEAATAGIDLPLRNKLVTYLVKLGAKIGPAGHAAAAIAGSLGEEKTAEPATADGEPDVDAALRAALSGERIGRRTFADEAADLKAGGGTDGYVLGKVGQFFGIGGRGKSPGGVPYTYHPGKDSKDPGFWFGTDRFKSPATLSGPALLIAVRRVFGIPTPAEDETDSPVGTEAAGKLPDFVLGENLRPSLVTPAQLDKAYMGDKLSTDEKKVKGPQKVGPGVAFLGTRYVCTGTESPPSAGPDASPVEMIWNLLRVYPAYSFEGLCPGVQTRLTPGRTEHGYYAGVRVVCDGKEMVIGPDRDRRRVVLMRKRVVEPAKSETKPATAPARQKHVKIDGDVAAVLAGAEADGTTLRLPPKQLDRKLYDRVNKVLEQLGGKWSKKEKVHTFPEPVAPLLEAALADGKVLDQKQSYQFFPTPPAIARKVIEAAGLEPGMRVLEPSAGLGAIADLVPADCTLVVCELHENMARTLRMAGKTVVPGDFLEYIPSERFDRVVMNPPFAGLQDAAHVRHAFALTKPGGRVVAIVSESTMGREATKAEEFRDWLDDLGAEIEPVPAGAFKESGTDAGAFLVVIDKPVACRACGCTDEDCSGCIEKTGRPCSWVEPDLCSACAGEKPTAKAEKTAPNLPAPADWQTAPVRLLGLPAAVAEKLAGAGLTDGKLVWDALMLARKSLPGLTKDEAAEVARVLKHHRGGPLYYGWDVTYQTNRGETLTCHYVGTEKQARRKAMLRTHAAKVIECSGLTEEQWVRAYGRGRM